ncbi:MAG: ubiquinol-cytochrome C chaperone [Alphaproteobacteria bacterium]|nr:ubiquinol-cytochrome C chaperone [Alphaproteobacteria bacterium]
MRALYSLFAKPYDRARRAAAHYTAIVSQARRAEFYESLGVPDTLDGRFDLIVLHASLYLKRLRVAGPEGRDLAQAVFDNMFDNLDQSLRELGVGDITLPKKIRAMVSAFYGRAAAYDKALSEEDEAALDEALVRNVYAGQAPGEDVIARLAAYLRATAKALAEVSDDALLSNQFHWLTP